MRWFSLLALCGALVGCEVGPRPEGPAVFDSLGATIVSHGLLGSSSAAAWHLGTQPRTVVGATEGSDVEILFDVIDAERLDDGSIAVVDRTRILRSFDQNGRLQWTTGRRGDGPGEFQWPEKVLVTSSDSLLVWDSRQRRLTVFTASGDLIRTETLGDVSGDTRALGLLDPGHLVLEVATTDRAPVNGRPAATRSAQYIGVDLNGMHVVELGGRVLSVQFREIDDSGPYSPAIFATSAVAAVAQRGIWFGDPSEAEVRLTTASGLERIIRWDGADRAISGSDVEAVLRHWGDSAGADPEEARYIREYGRTHPRADLFPAFDRLLTDQDGTLWIRRYVPDHQAEGLTHWVVMSPDGLEVLGRFTHSDQFDPLRFGPSWVLGIQRDTLDVQHVAVYDIVR